MPSGRPREQPREISLAHAQGEGAQILAIERQDVEGVELHLIIMLARVQGIEIGNAIDAEDDSLAIDDELLLSILECGFHDPRIAIGPVVAIAGDQAHTIAVALHAKPVTVIFDLVEPVRGGWNLGAASWDAKIKRL